MGRMRWTRWPRLADHLVLLGAGSVRAAGRLARRDDAGVVITARLEQHDSACGLMPVAVDGGTLRVGETQAAPGDALFAQIKGQALM